jgi:hypothetical protein
MSDDQPPPTWWNKAAWEFHKTWKVMAPEERSAALITLGTMLADTAQTAGQSHLTMADAMFTHSRTIRELFERLATAEAMEEDR